MGSLLALVPLTRFFFSSHLREFSVSLSFLRSQGIKINKQISVKLSLIMPVKSANTNNAELNCITHLIPNMTYDHTVLQGCFIIIFAD